MTLVTWRPMREFDSMFDRMNRMFGSQFHGANNEQEYAAGEWCPLTDIYETEEEYIFKVELPGMDKKDINIEVKDDVLWIRGERREDMDANKDNYHRIESRSGKFSRSFRLPRGIDQEKIKASMKNGILELKVAKPEEKKPKAISIN